MTTFSFQWITTEFLMKSHIYWYLKRYPFLRSYCNKIVFSYIMCILSQTLFLSTSLLLGSFRYVFNIIIVLTCIVSNCRFKVSLSLILLVFILCIYILYIYIYAPIGLNNGSGNGLLPDGTKPLPEPMLTCHHCGFWHSWRVISEEIYTWYEYENCRVNHIA